MGNVCKEFNYIILSGSEILLNVMNISLKTIMKSVIKGKFLEFMFNILKNYIPPKWLTFLNERLKNEKVQKSKYVIRIRNLKQALNHRLVLKKVHRVIKFNQNAWLKPYIDINNFEVILNFFFLRIH